MTGLQTLAARVALGVASGAAGVILSGLPAIHKPTPARFRQALCAAFLGSRLLLFAIVFLLLGVAPRGDIPAFYFPEAASALHGALPYRDFASSYAPLHSYVDAAVLLLWHSPLALILFAVLVEFVLLYLWLRVGSELFPEAQLRVASVLYLTSALSLQFVAIDGQDNVTVALLILVSLLLAMRSRPVSSGVATALAAVMVKLIPIFYAPVFFAGLKRRWAWAMGFAAAIALGYGSFALLGLPLFEPVAIEGPLKSAGTLPYLIESLTGLDLPIRFWDALMLLVLAAVYITTYTTVWKRCSIGDSRTQARSVLWGVATATMALLIFANKSWPAYLMLILFPLCLVIAASGLWARIAFASFSVVALAEHSYWATLLSQASAPEFHRALRAGNRMFLVLLLLELLLLGGYVWLLRRCVLELQGRSRTGPELPGSGSELRSGE